MAHFLKKTYLQCIKQHQLRATNHYRWRGRQERQAQGWRRDLVRQQHRLHQDDPTRGLELHEEVGRRIRVAHGPAEAGQLDQVARHDPVDVVRSTQRQREQERQFVE